MIQVLIGDKIEWSESRDEFLEIQSWAKRNCKSFRSMRVMDVSDVSARYDFVAEFQFTEERDATLFTLRWSTP